MKAIVGGLVAIGLGLAAPSGMARAQAGGGDIAVPLYIVHLTTGPAWIADKAAHEQAGFREHSQNLARMRSEGAIVIGARYKDAVADKGMVVVRAASREAVEAQFAGDPMVRDKSFVLDIAEFKPFYEGYVARTGRAAADQPLGALSWMAGCWAGQSGKSESREHWMRPAGGMMLGMARTIAGGKVVAHEAMRIEADAAGVPLFIPKPSGKPEATFRMIRSDATSIVFENPDKDFPQRVMYRLVKDGEMHARIEGMRNGKEAGVDFPMKRVGCE